MSLTDVDACENRQHPFMKAAKAAGLDTYWADFIPNDAAQYEMLVGRRWGIFGPDKGAYGVGPLRFEDGLKFRSSSPRRLFE